MVFAFLLLLVPDVASEQRRNSAAVAAFKRSNPCPANGSTKGTCTGYVVDHVHPLCAGGQDKPSNMQWQNVADAKAKDRLEVAECRQVRTKRIDETRGTSR
jgi:hypothetical protein